MNRRRFLQVGGISLLGAAGSRFSLASSQNTGGLGARFAYIGTQHEIHVYSISAHGRFILQQTVPSLRPVAMAISHGHLYVANAVPEYGNLPRGSAESYAIDAPTGHLTFKNRVPLSLSATLPHDLAIAPDGRSVVIAVYGGGAYNLLPIHHDGQLAGVSGILKEIGSGPHPSQAAAHPTAVLFDPAGRILAADYGADRLSMLSFSNRDLSLASRYQVPAGSGPSSMVLSPAGDRLYVSHALNGSLSTYEYGEKGILDHRFTVSLPAVGVAALAMHPSGGALYSGHANGVQVYQIASAGALQAGPGVPGILVNKLQAMPDGNSLLALSPDAVLSMAIDATNRTLAPPVKLASLSNPLGIAIMV